ncbi:MAG: sulfatase-like hydrolase/transferase [Candidatus Hydrogenedentes bacterium]|nr:sulfatase-like hydrolase/transferase [Candidatus Hydrogenedentota bacterium]
MRDSKILRKPTTLLSRRQFLSSAATAGLLCTIAPMVSAAPSRKPNVILIYTDDQGSVDLPSVGSSDLYMANVEALAAKGTRFTQFYAPSPVCSPSRAGALTGRYPLRAGVPNNVGEKGLPGAQVTLAETLKAAGYATAHIGKWHLGADSESNPNAQGFDYSFGHMSGCIDSYSHFFYWSGPNRHDLYRNGKEIFENGRFFMDLMVEEAGQFMEAHRDEPFFIYFAPNAPHYPYQGEPEWQDVYAKAGASYPRNLYASFLSTLDERIGALLAKVDALGLRNDTIVIYQADNGHSTEERAHFGGGSAGPYRGAKFSLFEGGIRVPAVISWPGRIPEGSVRRQVAHGCDWLPTIAELCGVPLLSNDIDGRSLVKMIRADQEPTPHDELHWFVGEAKSGGRWAVRKGDWKLLCDALDTSDGKHVVQVDGLFLANLADDPGERTNLAESHPEKLQELLQAHDAWYATARPTV